MNILEISHIKKNFGNREVLKDLSFSVPEHSIFGFVGQNGAGKTTTMKIILGLLDKDGGEITVLGERVHFGQTKTNRFVGYLPDIPEFYSFLTPVEYLRFCGDILELDKQHTQKKSEELLNLVGLADEKHKIKGFSRGMKQRLGIAQALLGEPKLLICDEPTSALDPAGRKEILDILIAAKEYTTVLFSTHILSDVERICDEIALLHNGIIMKYGTVEEIRQSRKRGDFELDLEIHDDIHKLTSVFPAAKIIDRNRLVFCDSENIENIMKYLLDNRISFTRLEKSEPTLESVFLEVIGK